MGADRALASAGREARTPSRNGLAGGRERDFVYGFDGLPVAAIAQEVSALLDRARLFLCLVARGRLCEYQIAVYGEIAATMIEAAED